MTGNGKISPIEMINCAKLVTVPLILRATDLPIAAYIRYNDCYWARCTPTVHPVVQYDTVDQPYQAIHGMHCLFPVHPRACARRVRGANYPASVPHRAGVDVASIRYAGLGPEP